MGHTGDIVDVSALLVGDADRMEQGGGVSGNGLRADRSTEHVLIVTELAGGFLSLSQL